MPNKFASKPALLSTGFWMLLPTLLGLLVLTYGPALVSLMLSFCDWDLLGPVQFVGLRQYQLLFTGSGSQPPEALWVGAITALFAGVCTVLETVLSLLLALVAFNQLQALGSRLGGLFRTACLLPMATPAIGAALVWGWLFDPAVGVLNAALMALGWLDTPVAWLYTQPWALGCVILLEIWKATGYNVLLLLAALEALPADVLAAARLDGAGGLGLTRQIVLPLLAPMLAFVMTITLIHTLQAFDAVYLLTQGGPENTTRVAVYALFQNAFIGLDAGRASAMGVLLFLVIAALTALQMRLSRARKDTAYG
ncbi:MAG: sugar ABC transporter permease [Vampirovibrionales bacterium]|nr:sugar ABC transporter permease [Vampirovibrionales bacterium]